MFSLQQEQGTASLEDSGWVLPFQRGLSSPTLSTLLPPWANCMDQSTGSLLLWLLVAFIQWGARRWWKRGGEERRLAGYLCPGFICGVTQGASAFSPEGHSSFALYTACLHVSRNLSSLTLLKIPPAQREGTILCGFLYST